MYDVNKYVSSLAFSSPVDPAYLDSRVVGSGALYGLEQTTIDICSAAKYDITLENVQLPFHLHFP